MLKTSFPSALRRLSVVLIAALCAALPAHAQWKWRDASGKLQFSDLPPPQGTPDKDILQRPAKQVQNIVIVPYGQAASTATAAPAAASAASAPSKAELERQARQKRLEKDMEAKQKAADAQVAEQRRENCQRAQENLKLLQDGVRLTRPNERGEAVVLDERQRAEEIQRSRTVVNSECR
ncbi:DUF4124 domain-containing protein [Paucibacter sp. AS339]|uniref:DUF4124 domain-containing protein n=1 Tax=Paucibacter hankyongi TaxID=3133434 RepID=UPI0030B15D40